MSEIPYVKGLGDALEAAIVAPGPAPRARRLGRRRRLAVAVAALTIAGGGAAMAELLADPVEIGFGSVGCFSGPDTGGDVAILSDPTRTPVENCAEALAPEGLTANDLISCSWEGHGVVAVAHEGRRSCAAHGLAPVPASYGSARRRAERMEALAKRFEREAGCLAPREFARGLTAELRAGGFAGWRAVPAGGGGPCGRVSVPDGSSMLGSIGPAVDATKRTIAVKGTASLEVERVIFGAGSPGVSLFDASGERCFTMPELERHVLEVLEPAGVPIRFSHGELPADTGIEEPRGSRYAEGCAIFVGAGFEFEDGRTLVDVALWQRGAGG